MSKVFTVTLPDIGEGVVEGEVIEWLKNEGDPLAQDEPVVIVMTDKATVELPSPHPGKLLKRYFKAGETAILHRPLYDIEVLGEITAAAVQEAPKIKQECVKECVSFQEGKVLSTPPVRHLAKQLGIDINQVTPSGEGGRVILDDLKNREAPISNQLLPGDVVEPLVGIPALMAKKMAESKRQIPHFSYFEKVDAGRLVHLRESSKQLGEKEGVHVTFMPFLIRAISLTILKFPILNSSCNGKSVIYHTVQNIGIAMATPLGLIVPVLKGVESLKLHDLIRAYEKLKEQAQAGTLKSQDMKGSTFTISNFGVLGGGGLFATPIINYPESAILAVSKIQKEPFVKNDALVVAETLNLSWSFDHRIIDGDHAAKISHHFATLLHNPASLL